MNKQTGTNNSKILKAAEHVLIGFRPSREIVDSIDNGTLNERATAATSSIRWWLNAHQNNTPYHAQFKGYCPTCVAGNS